MKLNSISKKKSLKSLTTAAMIILTAITPMQAMAYTQDQVGKLDNQPKVSSTLTFNDNQRVPVALKGQPTNLKTPAYVTGGRTLLPIRGAAELLNAEVNFQPDNNLGLVQITKDANEVLLQIGRNKIMKNGIMSQIDTSNPKIGAATFKGTTYLPLRAVADALGVQVEYSNGKVNIITGDGTITPPVTPPVEVNGMKLVPNTNPDIFTSIMDANSVGIKGDLWEVPSGLIYKSVDGLKPGDKLTNEQKDRLLTHMANFSPEVTDSIHSTDYIYLPSGTKITASDRKISWIFNDISYQGVLGYGFRAVKGEVLSPTNSWSGVVAFKDGTYGTISAGACKKIREKGLAQIKYAIYDTGYYTRNNISYVTFYNL